MEKYLYLSKQYLAKNKNNNAKLKSMYLSNKFCIYVNNNGSEEQIISNKYFNEVYEILKRIEKYFNEEPSVVNKIVIDDNPIVFKNSIKRIIKGSGISKLVKILKTNPNLKYISELETIIFLFFIKNDEEFKYLHEEYLNNIKKFIEKKYFKSTDVVNFEDDIYKIKILNKIVYNTFKTRNIDNFIEYLKMEIKIYLRLRNSYNIRIKEIRRRIEYEDKSDSYIYEYKGNKLYEPACSDSKESNLLDRVIEYLVKNNYMNSNNDNFESVIKSLDRETINKIKEEILW